MASTDSLADNTAFAKKNAASFPILADPEKKMTRDYGALMAGAFAKRWTFYIDSSGIIVSIDKSVSPRSAGADLVANLIRLQIPKRGRVTWRCCAAGAHDRRSASCPPPPVLSQDPS